ncbi:UDP-3-O-(3-hydroxymyristoyl)glucosamine N-acyltransferase [Lyticum sinuosum]|uniref:UDP-3-O-acylglucosamine N-acyltransferase n=1 Tax=Lyticum sinuosum TaxID=1332059 RepID=A0AAE5AI39_9RICK|nr:UDP-3-O-(3-hydroxymyristoyl)glucosamine N-acyltransferase [Lyticum sinuosum]MDZ5761599.1 UDP-3-O-acylglucosamine N-acyltransferase [Lyticum sinuosum]
MNNLSNEDIFNRFTITNNPISLKDIILKTGSDISINCKNQLNEDLLDKILIFNIRDIRNATNTSITFLYNLSYIENLKQSNVPACFVSYDLAEYIPETIIPILNINPQLAYSLTIDLLYSNRYSLYNHNNNNSNINITSQIGKNSSIDNTAIICENSIIGNNVTIGRYSIVGPGVIINDDVVIEDYVILQSTVVGNGSIIRSGAKIGQSGFGYTIDVDFNAKNQLEKNNSKIIINKILHVGFVKIGNNTEIGCNTCIDRGVLSGTIIGDETKIDNLCQIGHNVIVGNSCFICGQVGIAGSANIGNNVKIGGQAGIAGHISIGNNVSIGAKSGVINSLEEGESVVGFPAVSRIKFWRGINKMFKFK